MPTPRPLTLEESLRSILRRLRILESRRAVRAGAWVLETREDDGALVARNTATGAVHVLAP